MDSIMEGGSMWSLHIHLIAIQMKSSHIGDARGSSHKTKRGFLPQLKVGIERCSLNYFEEPLQPLYRPVANNLRSQLDIVFYNYDS